MKALLSAAVLLALASGAWAQRVYPIVELTNEDVGLIDIHDGSVDDWLDVIGEPTLTALNFETNPEGQPYDPFSMDYRIWLAWHDATDRIFVAMERSDDVYINEYGTQAWEDSRIFENDSLLGFWVDGDHSGGESFVQGITQTAQGYYAIAEVFGDHPQIMPALGGALHSRAFSVKTPFAEAGGGSFGEEPTITVTELYVTPFDVLVIDVREQRDYPEESSVSDLHAGKIIGFSISVYDHDGVGLRNVSYQHLLSEDLPQTVNEFSPISGGPEFWVDGLLVGPGGEIPSDTAVEHITWAQIKASLVE